MKLVTAKLRKRVFAAAAAAVMTVSAFGGISADAFEVWSFSDDLTVYVNGQKIDNTIYKPIIANDRTLVRLVPVFEALGYEYGEMDENKMIQFVQKDTNSVYTFKAESTKAVAGTGAILEDGFPEGEEHYLDVPATLQFCDVFYVPIRSFCEMTNLDIEWDDATRTVYVGSKPETAENHALTYNEARALAEQYVNDSSISLSENTTPVTYNGKSAYEFRLYSKGMTSGGGSGFMGMIVYVYIDNGEIVTAEGSGEQQSTTPPKSGIFMSGDPGKLIGYSSYCCAGYDVSSGKDIVRQYMNNEITASEVAEFSQTHRNTNHTSTGITIQTALDMIKSAYAVEFTGTATVYENCVTASSNGGSYGVSYDPETDVYYVASSSVSDIVKDGDDSNSTVRILNSAGEIIGWAN